MSRINMIKKLSYKLSIIVVCWLAIAVSCDCEKRTYKIIDLAVVEAEGKWVDNPNGSGQILSFDSLNELQLNDTVSYRNVGFKFNTKSQSLSIRSTGSIFPKAMACDEKLLVPTQTISKVKITSSNPYITPTGTITAGEDLNDVFGLNDLGPRATMLGDLLYDNFPIYFILRSKPSETQLHQFTFVLSLDDGTELSAQTEPLYIAE